MIRDRLRAGLRRLAGAFRRIPSEPPTGRAPPTQAEAWRPRAAPPAAQPPPPPEPDAADEPEVEVEPAALAAWRAEGRAPVLLDIREPHELASGYARGSWLMPMNSVPQRLSELPRDQPLLVICAAGARSYSVSHYLRGQGFPEAWSLAGGVGGLLGRREDTLFAAKDAPLRVLGACALRQAEGGLPAGARGQIEAATRAEGAWVYAARFPLPAGGSLRLDGLSEDALQAP